MNVRWRIPAGADGGGPVEGGVGASSQQPLQRDIGAAAMLV